MSKTPLDRAPVREDRRVIPNYERAIECEEPEMLEAESSQESPEGQV